MASKRTPGPFQDGWNNTMEVASHELALDRSGDNENDARAWIDQEAQALLWMTSDSHEFVTGALSALHKIARAMESNWSHELDLLFTAEARERNA